MGRLEDIVARNKNPTRSRERLWVMIALGMFLLLILTMMVFTNLGARPEPPVRKPERGRVNDIYIQKVPQRAAPRDAGAPHSP